MSNITQVKKRKYTDTWWYTNTPKHVPTSKGLLKHILKHFSTQINTYTLKNQQKPTYRCKQNKHMKKHSYTCIKIKTNVVIGTQI